MGLGIRGWRRVGLGLCKVGGVGSRSNSAPWILCSAVRTSSNFCYFIWWWHTEPDEGWTFAHVWAHLKAWITVNSCGTNEHHLHCHEAESHLLCFTLSLKPRIWNNTQNICFFIESLDKILHMYFLLSIIFDPLGLYSENMKLNFIQSLKLSKNMQFAADADISMMKFWCLWCNHWDLYNSAADTDIQLYKYQSLLYISNNLS